MQRLRGVLEETHCQRQMLSPPKGTPFGRADVVTSLQGKLFSRVKISQQNTSEYMTDGADWKKYTSITIHILMAQTNLWVSVLLFWI